MKSDTCREKLKGKREVYRRSDGRQELRSCIRSGISQAASRAHSAVVLYGLAFVFSERAELHCSELSAVDLFVPRPNRLRQSSSGQGERQSERPQWSRREAVRAATVVKARGRQSGH